MRAAGLNQTVRTLIQQLLLALTLIGPAHPASAATCTRVALTQSANTITLEDHVPAFFPRCYDFEARAGQTVTVDVARGDDMLLGLDEVAPDGKTNLIADERTTYTFKSDGSKYRVYIASKKNNADTTKTFSLTVTRH